MALARESITTSPKSPSHMRVVIDRLRNRTSSVISVLFPGEWTTDSNLAVGEVVYASGDGTLDLAIATGLATSRVVGIAIEAASAGATVIIQTTGVVENPGWSLTPNTVYYLDESTPGALTATAPTSVGETVVPVGIAVSATELRLLSQPPILL